MGLDTSVLSLTIIAATSKSECHGRNANQATTACTNLRPVGKRSVRFGAGNRAGSIHYTDLHSLERHWLPGGSHLVDTLADSARHSRVMVLIGQRPGRWRRLASFILASLRHR